MKTIIASLCLLALVVPRAPAAEWQEQYGLLLKKYVSPAGVRYAAWKANQEDISALDVVTNGIAEAPASTAKTKEQLAFHINAYNAWILHEVLKKYPTRSVKDPLFTFFTGKKITVAGEKMSFNHLEKEIIRPRFNEPRIHFALNCASRSCPPLRAEPYEAARLDAQLDEQARAYVNSELGVKASGETAQYSRIFDWYKDDFGGEAGVSALMEKYRKGKSKFKAITYQEYDWNLNEAK